MTECRLPGSSEPRSQSSFLRTQRIVYSRWRCLPNACVLCVSDNADDLLRNKSGACVNTKETLPNRRLSSKVSTCKALVDDHRRQASPAGHRAIRNLAHRSADTHGREKTWRDGQIPRTVGIGGATRNLHTLIASSALKQTPSRHAGRLNAWGLIETLQQMLPDCLRLRVLCRNSLAST